MTDLHSYEAQVDVVGATVRVQVVTSSGDVHLDATSAAIAQAVGKVAMQMMEAGHPTGWET